MLRWPEPTARPGLMRVGSALDLLLIDAAASGPQAQRLRGWPLDELPLCCDALVLPPEGHSALLAGPTRMATELARDNGWLWQRR